VAVEDEEFKAAETAGGYAKEMSREYQAKQAALVAEHIAKQDIVITTALIPGRPAPKLVSAAMVASMKPGSVLVDLAVERGGNVEGAVPGAVITLENGVKIVGHLNVPGRIAASASLLYARNLYAFVETMVDKTTKTLAVDREDELVRATMLTDGGRVVHPAFANAVAAAAEKPKPIVPGQNRGDDPATDEGGASAKAGPKKPTRKTAKKADKPASGGEA
jgi:NAD(P) transhydrogenase subunit alpha